MADNNNPSNGDLATRKQSLRNKLLNKFARDIARIENIPPEKALEIAKTRFGKQIEYLVAQIFTSQTNQLTAIKNFEDPSTINKIANEVQNIDENKIPQTQQPKPEFSQENNLADGENRNKTADKTDAREQPNKDETQKAQSETDNNAQNQVSKGQGSIENANQNQKPGNSIPQNQEPENKDQNQQNNPEKEQNSNTSEPQNNSTQTNAAAPVTGNVNQQNQQGGQTSVQDPNQQNNQQPGQNTVLPNSNQSSSKGAGKQDPNRATDEQLRAAGYLPKIDPETGKEYYDEKTRGQFEDRKARESSRAAEKAYDQKGKENEEWWKNGGNESADPKNKQNTPPGGNNTKSGIGNLKPGTNNTKPGGTTPIGTKPVINGGGGIKKPNLNKAPTKLGGNIFRKSNKLQNSASLNVDPKNLSIEKQEKIAALKRKAEKIQKKSFKTLQSGNSVKALKEQTKATKIENKISKLTRKPLSQILVEKLKELVVNALKPVLISALMIAITLGGVPAAVAIILCAADNNPTYQNILPGELKGFCGGDKNGGAANCPAGYVAWVQDANGKWVQGTQTDTTSKEVKNITGSTADQYLVAVLSIYEAPTIQGRLDVAQVVVNRAANNYSNHGSNVRDQAFAENQFQPFFTVAAGGYGVPKDEIQDEASAINALKRGGFAAGTAKRIINEFLASTQDPALVQESASKIGVFMSFRGVTQYDFRTGGEFLRTYGENYFFQEDSDKNVYKQGSLSNFFKGIKVSNLEQNNQENLATNTLANVTNNVKQFFDPIKAEAQAGIGIGTNTQTKIQAERTRLADLFEKGYIYSQDSRDVSNIRSGAFVDNLVLLMLKVYDSGYTFSTGINNGPGRITYNPDSDHTFGRAMDFFSFAKRNGKDVKMGYDTVNANETFDGLRTYKVINVDNIAESRNVVLDVLAVMNGSGVTKQSIGPDIIKSIGAVQLGNATSPGHYDHIHFAVTDGAFNNSGATPSTTSTSSRPTVCCPPGVTPTGAGATANPTGDNDKNVDGNLKGADPNILALMEAIAIPESKGRYDIRYPATTFTDTYHPAIVGCAVIKDLGEVCSDASGKYQTLSYTFLDWAVDSGLAIENGETVADIKKTVEVCKKTPSSKDCSTRVEKSRKAFKFNKANQDYAVYQFLYRNGLSAKLKVSEAVFLGKDSPFCSKPLKEWASSPCATDGQPRDSIDDYYKNYKNAGGKTVGTAQNNLADDLANLIEPLTKLSTVFNGVQVYAQSSKEFSYKSKDGNTMSGTLFLPAGFDKTTYKGNIVILGHDGFQGAGGDPFDYYRANLDTGEEISNKGSAVFVIDYEKASEIRGGPRGTQQVFSTDIDDTIAAMDALQKEFGLKNNFTLAGTSRGAGVSALAASRDARVSKLAIAYPVVKFSQYKLTPTTDDQYYRKASQNTGGDFTKLDLINNPPANKSIQILYMQGDSDTVLYDPNVKDNQGNILGPGGDKNYLKHADEYAAAMKKLGYNISYNKYPGGEHGLIVAPKYIVPEARQKFIDFAGNPSATVSSGTGGVSGACIQAGSITATTTGNTTPTTAVGALTNAKDSGDEFSKLTDKHKAFMKWIAEQRLYTGPFGDNGGPDPAAKAAADKLLARAKADGLKMIIAGDDGKYGYRGYNSQTGIFLGKIAADKQYQDSMGAGEQVPEPVRKAYLDRAKLSAPVGYSEHHSGKAMDFIIEGMTDENLDPDKYDTEVAKWLATNAPKEGFKLTYPPENSKGVTKGAGYEPWHWFYQGK